MTEVLRPDSEPISDSELIALVRAGDAAAYEELFVRHRAVALRYARRLSDSERAEDLCAEAFTKIFDLLQRGKGPDVAFRAYLLTTVRTSHLNNLRRGSREDLVPDHEPISRMMPVIEDPDARFDRNAICRAFYQLPERWRVVLWLTSVEGYTHDEVSERLGLKSNAVASLAFRARAGLRQAYLAEHLLEATEPRCRTVVQQLPTYLRDRVTPRRRRQVEEHLDGCASCTTAALELTEVDTRLGGLLAPLALTGVAAGAVQASGALAALKGLGGNIVGTLGAKTAAAVAVAALSVAVGAEIVRDGDASAPHPDLPTAVEAPTSRPTAPARPHHPPSAAAEPGPVYPSSSWEAPRRRPGSPPRTSAPEVLPPTDSPSPTPPSSTPTTTPTTAPTGSPGPTTPRIGEVTVEPVQDGFVRWERVTVPVSDPVEGATMVVTTARTLQVGTPVTTGTGWVCGVPTTSWFDGASAFATSRIVCSFDGGGDGSPLQLSYHVLPGAPLAIEVGEDRFEATLRE